MVSNAKVSKGYCVFVESISEGAVPSVFDGDNEPVVFGTREEADAEIQDYVDTRLAHAVDENETKIYIEDTEEFVVEVRILENGTVLPVF